MVREKSSLAIQDLHREDQGLIVWSLTALELQSALARRARESRLNSPQRRSALSELSRLEETWSEITPSEQILGRARRLVQVHPLSAADALQLAAAMELQGEGLAPDFVCLDSRLREAAEKEGFRVLPEDQA